MIHTRLPVLGAMALMIFNCGVAVAGPSQTSADYVMPGCRDAASLITFSKTAESEEQVSLTGFCAGIVVGLSFMGQPYGICVPADTTSQQVTSIVVQYIDGQPARIHEDFNPFAVEALRANWPCSLVANRGTPVTTSQANLPTSGHPEAVEKESFSVEQKIVAVSESNPATSVKTEAVKTAASKTQDSSPVTSSNNLASNRGIAVPTGQANLPTSGHPEAVEKQSFSAEQKIAAVSEPNSANVKTEAVKTHAFSGASKTQDSSPVTSSNNLAKQAEAQTSSSDLPPAAARQGQRDFPVNVPPGWSLAPGKSNEWRAVSPRRNAWLSLYVAPVHSGSSDLDRGAAAGDRVTYQQRGRGWNVVSGYTADNRIFYRKTMLACGGRKWHKLEFEYPASDKRAMDEFVTRASHALGAYSSAGC
jgi:Rap1a immunity proteins